MSAGRRQRLGDPSVYRAVVNQIDIQSSNSRLEQQMDRYMGKKTASLQRWKTMKRKYSIHKESSRKASGQLQLNPQTILRIQARQRSKVHCMSIDLLTHKSGHPSDGSFSKNSPRFFKAGKQALKYIQCTSPAYQKLKTEEIELRSRHKRRQWRNFPDKGVHEDPKRNFEHPVLGIYKDTCRDVIRSTKAKRQFKKPFQWFVSPLQLEDF